MVRHEWVSQREGFRLTSNDTAVEVVMGGGASAGVCTSVLDETRDGCPAGRCGVSILSPSFLYNMSVKYFVIEGISIETGRESRYLR